MVRAVGAAGLVSGVSGAGGVSEVGGMKKRITAVVFLAIMLTVGLIAPSGAQAASRGWVRGESQNFIWWVPNGKWVVSPGTQGIEISSPTGTAQVSFAYATNAPRPYTLDEVRILALSPAAGLTQVRVRKQGTAYATGAGGQGRVSEFTAVRSRDRKVVRGVLTAQVFNNYTAYSFGIAAYLRMAPANQWKKWDKTTARVQARITAMGNAPDWTYVR